MATTLTSPPTTPLKGSEKKEGAAEDELIASWPEDRDFFDF